MMKYEVVEMDEWVSICLLNDNASFFNSKEWNNIISNYLKIDYKIWRIAIKDQDYYILTFQKETKLFFKKYDNSPFGVYAGIISKDSYNEELEHRIIDQCFKHKNFNYTGSPFLNSPRQSDLDFTQVVNLEKLNEADFTKNHKRNIAKARSYGLTISETEDFSEWKEYYKIYIDVIKLRGKKSSNDYQLILFKLIFELPLEHRKLWVIRKNKVILGGGLFFYDKQVTYWHGANNEICKKYGGSHLLHAEVMQESKTAGYSIYDFNPSGGHIGVEKFKAGFRTEKLYFIRKQNKNLIYRLAFKVYSKWNQYLSLNKGNSDHYNF